MRAIFIAIAATMVVASTTPTFAVTRNYNPTPSYNTCETLSIERGVAPGRGVGSNPEGQHNAFLRQCLAGEIPIVR